jgi:hypothetical protein
MFNNIRFMLRSFDDGTIISENDLSSCLRSLDITYLSPEVVRRRHKEIELIRYEVEEMESLNSFLMERFKHV